MRYKEEETQVKKLKLVVEYDPQPVHKVYHQNVEYMLLLEVASDSQALCKYTFCHSIANRGRKCPSKLNQASKLEPFSDHWKFLMDLSDT